MAARKSPYAPLEKALLPPMQRVALIREKPDTYGLMRSAQDVVQLVRPLLDDSADEVMVCVALNTRHAVVGVIEVVHGTVAQAPIDVGGVMRIPLLLNAPALILVHNHPSGDPTPSSDDIQLTRQLSAAAKLLTLKLVDHVIVAANGWVSMRERSLMD